MLRIAVCLNQVPDPVSVEIDPLSGEIKQDRLVYITNPADAAALELALRWRDLENGPVLALSYGPNRVDPILREALALGADEVKRIWNETETVIEPPVIARALASVLGEWQPDLILCGNRSTDYSSGQVPGYLADLLGLPQASGLATAEYDPPNRQVLAERKLDRGRRERLLIPLPALLSVEVGIAQPRYASLPALMDARRSQIEVISLTENVAGQTEQVKLVEVRPPRPRARQIFIPDPDLPAAARIEAILSGGAATGAKKGKLVEGSPEAQADRILAFLEEAGLLEKDEG